MVVSTPLILRNSLSDAIAVVVADVSVFGRVEHEEAGLEGRRIEENEDGIDVFLVSVNGILEGTEDEGNDCPAGTISLSLTASMTLIELRVRFLSSPLSCGTTKLEEEEE